MEKMIHRKQITSDELPFISFAARGTLLHDNPSFEKYCVSYFSAMQNQLSEQQIRQILIQKLIELNTKTAAGEDIKADLSFFLRAVIEALRLSDVDKELQKAEEVFRQGLKVVIPATNIEVLETLRERGYRLAIVSNEGSAMLEVLKIYQLLDLFDCVILGEEVQTYKPSSKIFEILLEDLEINPRQLIHIGDRFSADVLGSQRAAIESILYDPQQYEVLAINKKDKLDEKVISIESLRKNRQLENVKVISKFEELLEFFK